MRAPNGADTIAAIASPPGPAERGIVRISGPAARFCLGQLFQAEAGELSGERGLWSGRVDDGRGTQPALVVWMPAPRSFTREDVAELHVPGHPALLNAVLTAVLRTGVRLARPGEFTRRAFENGRIDLSQAEGLLAFVEAAQEAECRAGARLLDGGLARRVAHLRAGLEDLAALCEASLDFDEADTQDVATDELLGLARDRTQELAAALGWEVARQPPGVAPRVQLFGAPNAGKSSLFNALAAGAGCSSAAIVNPLAGTTRDSLHALLALGGGREVLLADAPGLEPGSGVADVRAQELAADARRSADLVLWVVDARRGVVADELDRERQFLTRPTPVVLVWNQTDRVDAVELGARGAWMLRWSLAGRVELALAPGQAAQGLEALRGAILNVLFGAGESETPSAGLARELFVRHRRSLEEAAQALASASQALAAGQALDLCAEELRDVVRALDGIFGRTLPEDLLDRIFARFCLGK